MRRKLVFILLLVFLSSTACSREEEKESVTLAGSTSVTPFAEKIAHEFEEEHKGVLVDIQGLGSTAGIRAVADGTVDIGMSSRELEESEKSLGIEEHIIAYEGIAVITNPKNTVRELSLEEVRKIFTGEITNWSELGGPDKRIIVVSREAGSGTRGAFDELVGAFKEVNDKKVSTVTREALVADGNGSVRQNVSGKDYAVGYISIGYLDDSVSGVKIDEVVPSTENVVKKKYKLARPFLMLTKENTSLYAKEYLDFVLSDKGQDIMEKAGAVPVRQI